MKLREIVDRRGTGLMTFKEVGRAIGRPKSAVQKYALKHGLPFVRQDGHQLVPADELREWIGRHGHFESKPNGTRVFRLLTEHDTGGSGPSIGPSTGHIRSRDCETRPPSPRAEVASKKQVGTRTKATKGAAPKECRTLTQRRRAKQHGLDTKGKRAKRESKGNQTPNKRRASLIREPAGRWVLAAGIAVMLASILLMWLFACNSKLLDWALGLMFVAGIVLVVSPLPGFLNIDGRYEKFTIRASGAAGLFVLLLFAAPGNTCADNKSDSGERVTVANEVKAQDSAKTKGDCESLHR